ncbi:MAG: MATE family efflux transporter [Clostridia bacterium]|nr:MATE family efflux transporter [Clostridia bacterium]
MRKTDMTEGALLPSILFFSLPIIIGQLIQVMFNMADQVVLGQMAGTNAFASVGACAVICGLIVNLFCGLSGGVNIVLSRYAGAKADALVRKTVNTVMTASLVLGIFAAALSIPLSAPMLRLTNCPDECFEGACVYLRIYCSSMPAMLVYNFGATVIRVSGDSKRPLFYLILAGLMNVGLNVLLCLVLEQKVAAVAIATLASQIVGAVLVVRHLLKLDDSFRLHIKELSFDLAIFGKIMRYGLPFALNGCMFSISNLQIQSAINSYGAAAIAGNTAAQSVEGFLASFQAGFNNACLTFCGQNLGAKNIKRVRLSVIYALILSVVITAVASSTVYIFREPLLGVFVPGDAAAVGYGCIREYYLVRFYYVAAINGILASTIQAFGYSSVIMADSVVTVLIFRIIWMAYVYPSHTTFDNLMLCFLVSWLFTMLTRFIILPVVYLRHIHGHERKI